MKNHLLITMGLLLGCAAASSQTLTLVTAKRVYDHHSSSLSNSFYGNYNVNTQSGYDFVAHMNRPSGVPGQAPNRDIIEHNGYFGWNGSTWGIKFGFTNGTTNLGNTGYQGNNISRFYLNSAVTFSNLTTVNDLVAAYNSTLASQFDTAVAIGNVYIGKIRNTDQYVAMLITDVSNPTPAQVVAMDNGQQLMLDVYFEFDYKYGTLAQVATGLDKKDGQPARPVVGIYPSPAGSQLFLSSTDAVTRYAIRTITGAEAVQGSAESLSEGFIDIRQLEAGIYFLELWNESGVMQRNKFIKE